MNRERKAAMDKARNKRRHRAAVREEEVARGTAKPDPSPGIVRQVKGMAAGPARGLGKAVKRIARGVGDMVRKESE